MTEFEELKTKIEKMIDGLLPVNQSEVNRYNELCRAKRDSEVCGK